LTGDESWPHDCSLRFVAGEQFGPHSSVAVKALRPGEVIDVSVEMISPVEPGIHQGQWKMCTASGLYFGGEYG
jgi:Ig-like domain from next to BRCA1 gene